MSIDGINARWGSTCTVYRPTVGNDSITWGSAVLSGIKLDLMPVTNEVDRNVFGADVKIEIMVLTTSDIRKGDGITVSAGTYSGSRFRVSAALPFRLSSGNFVQAGLVATTETIP